MFEKLGYKVVQDDEYYLGYYGKIECVWQYITFDKEDGIYSHTLDTLYQQTMSDTLEEYAAIEKQFQELGYSKIKKGNV